MAGPLGRGFWWRLAAICLAAAAAFAVLSFALNMAGAFDVPPQSRHLPLALDFDAYWSAARIALHGDVRTAYDNRVIEAFERAHTTIPSPGYLAFYYPPTFLLLCLPFALMPYLWALLAFLAAQAALIWPLTRRVLVQAGGARLGWLPVLAMPGFLMNAFAGQNGGFSASCFAGAMLLLDDRPFLGGACLGALTCKPQLAIIAPLALACARRWRAMAGAGCIAISLALISFFALGEGAWAGFIANGPAARADIENLPIKWRFSQSTYAAIRLMGGSVNAGYAAQAMVAAVAIGLMASICWRKRSGAMEMAAASVAALLVSPYLNDYDLALLAAPLAWLAGSAVRTGFRWGETPLLLGAYILPFVARAAGLGAGVVLAPPVLLLLLIALRRRAITPAAAVQ